MSPEGAQSDSTIGTLQGRLTGLQDLIRSGARRSWRFSWFSWGFLLAVYLGTGLAAVLMVTTTVNSHGASPSSTSLLWVYPMAMLPAVVVLALAVREVLLGRHEARTELPPNRPLRREAASPPGAGWTEVVQRSQQLIANMRSETETAFLPLTLGGISLGVILGQLYVLPSLGVAYPLAILAVYLVPVPFLLLLAPFYLAVRGWTRGYQTLLDRQVDSLSRLEQEFFARFAGVVAGA